jgi:hypothetical protein
MSNPRPYLTAALLCDKVLVEANGTVSIIRLADRASYQALPNGNILGLPEGARPVFSLSGFIALKSGPVTGEHVVRVVVENPKGRRTEIQSFNVPFMGKDAGNNLVLNMVMGIELDGLHWFDVMFDDDVLTRIPLVIGPEPILEGQAPNP